MHAVWIPIKKMFLLHGHLLVKVKRQHVTYVEKGKTKQLNLHEIVLLVELRRDNNNYGSTVICVAI